MKLLQRTVAKKSFIRNLRPISIKVEPWIRVPGNNANFNVQLTEETLNEFSKLPTELNSKCLRVERDGNHLTNYHFVGDEAFVSKLESICNNMNSQDEGVKAL